MWCEQRGISIFNGCYLYWCKTDQRAQVRMGILHIKRMQQVFSEAVGQFHQVTKVFRYWREYIESGLSRYSEPWEYRDRISCPEGWLIISEREFVYWILDNHHDFELQRVPRGPRNHSWIHQFRKCKAISWRNKFLKHRHSNSARGQHFWAVKADFSDQGWAFEELKVVVGHNRFVL